MEKLHQIWKEEAKELGVDDSKLIDIYEERVVEEYNRYQDLASRIDKMNQNKNSIL